MTVANVRDLFPIAARRAYLNNAAISPVSQPVLQAVDSFLHDVRDNGDKSYSGWCVYADTDIKSRVGRLIGADAAEIAFVKNTTEGLVTVANGLDWKEGDNLLLPEIEYPSNVLCWKQLARRGVTIKWIKARDGRIDIADISAAIDARTRLVSVSAVQFSNGFRQDLVNLSDLCVSRGLLLNVDAIQQVGSMALNLGEIHIDFLSFGGHKWLLAPIGTGIFYCNRKSLDFLVPPNVGYHSFDHGDCISNDLDFRPNAGRFEEALVNFPGIWGLDAAVRMHLAVGQRRTEAHILDLTDYAAERLRSHGWTIKSPRDGRERSGLLSFGRTGINAEETALHLRAQGIDIAVQTDRLRISPSLYNNRDDIDRLVAALPIAHNSFGEG
ncbi:aminotransferase class V-fold PLP-dependent enzyme [Mesorhizobium sp. M1E.F.Ca.ET.041.01.1.1]|nr:aminotransferase class V-fold PLP-dependent enzyme [Mesorhizobium sp. M1E.F.Ca.ET.041.01.1.1]